MQQTNSTEVYLFEDAADAVRDEWKDERGFMTKSIDVGEADDSWKHELCERVEDVLESKGIPLDEDVVVRVPEYTYKDPVMGHPYMNVASCVRTLADSVSEHVIVLDGWVFERIPVDAQRGIIAHELCHARTNEVYGTHEENSDEFQRLLDKYDTPAGDDGIDFDLEALGRKHPSATERIDVDVRVGDVD